MKSVAVILGSAFQDKMPEVPDLEPVKIRTNWGTQPLFRTTLSDRPAYVLFRHGMPYRLLPNQINYRAQAEALKLVDCGALLVTSSVGVMDAGLPLFQPLLLNDLIMLENRLPDGTVCTMFAEPSPEHGHLVMKEGVFSKALNDQLLEFSGDLIHRTDQDIVFAYVAGPRTKTRAENRFWPMLGAQVDSMTLAPEVVLANEMEIPCAGLVVGHKYSLPEIKNPESRKVISDSLQASKEAMLAVILRFLKKGKAVQFGNQIYR